MQHSSVENRIVSDAVSARELPSVMMVDASNFSLSYDHCLCEALHSLGCNVTLARSEDIHGDWNVPTRFGVWKEFYSRTHARAKSSSRGRMWRVAKAGEHLLGMRKLAAKVESSRPDIIHFQWLPAPAFDSIFMRRLRRVAPLVLTLHNTTVFHGTAGRLHGVGLRAALKNFDAVVLHTEYSKRQVIAQQWVESERLHVIPHGALTHYRALAEVKPKARDEQVVLFFGNLKEYKGVDVLLQAFARLPLHVRNTAVLRIVGKPSMDVRPLQALARSLGIQDRVRWELRFVQEREVAEIFSEATVVGLPYREIDQSGVLLTAIAFDRVVVASDIGGISETIQDGVHGHLVPTGDVVSLSTALEAVLRHPERRRLMETAVSSLRRELAWEQIAQKTVEVYRGLGHSSARKRAA